ncbi:MAG: M56 family metallopeptidase [Acidobacteria bacterium]|nr:M56 family metallopeptidase [Acidobacteriota bacterium]
MTFDARLAVVALAAFASANAVGSYAAIWQWRHRRAPISPVDRASFLVRIRLLPLVAGLSWSVLALGSFFLFESRSNERTGLMLPVLAVLASALLLSAAARLTVTLRRHRRIVRGWFAGGTSMSLPGIEIPVVRVDAAFPIVAVVGVFRPKLVIASSVLAACTPDELQAILDHECGHITRGDNLRRTLLVALPDLLGWFRVGREIDRAWHDATEEVADEAPGHDRGDAGRVSLAAALLRVAKLVPSGEPPAEIPVSALYRGEPLERRVRRLLEPIPPRPRTPRHYQWLALAGIIALSVVLLYPIHELLEVAVTFLP